MSLKRNAAIPTSSPGRFSKAREKRPGVDVAAIRHIRNEKETGTS